MNFEKLINAEEAHLSIKLGNKERLLVENLLRDMVEISIKTIGPLEAQLREANEVVGDWLKFETYSIERNGEYVEKEINALINSAREYLERHKIAE